MNIKYIIIILFSFILQEKPSNNAAKEGEDPDCRSYVEVFGATNVNQFSMSNNSLQVVQEVKDLKNVQPVKIPVDSFTTSRPGIKKDLYELLKVEDHPYIEMNFERMRLEEIRDGTPGEDIDIRVNLGGIVHTYKVPCTLNSCDKSSYLIEGNFDLKLSDFGVVPPKKFLGLVKAKDELEVDFACKFQEDDPIFR